MGPRWKRLLSEDGGQDVIEYALLAAFVAILAAGLQSLGSGLGGKYVGWQDATQLLWTMPPPSGGS
jgi:Flp pilus assembly pilin Flp